MSIEVPTGNPDTNLPPLNTSNIAISSATLRGGWYKAILFPNTISAELEVVLDNIEASKFGEGIMP